MLDPWTIAFGACVAVPAGFVLGSFLVAALRARRHNRGEGRAHRPLLEDHVRRGGRS